MMSMRLMSDISNFSVRSMRYASCGIALLLVTMLASCVTTDPRLIAALQQTSVREIRIRDSRLT